MTSESRFGKKWCSSTELSRNYINESRVLFGARQKKRKDKQHNSRAKSSGKRRQQGRRIKSSHVETEGREEEGQRNKSERC